VPADRPEASGSGAVGDAVPAGRWRVRGGVVVWCRAGCGSSAPGESLAMRCYAVSMDVPPRSMPSAWDERETLVECESVGWRWSGYGGIEPGDRSVEG